MADYSEIEPYSIKTPALKFLSNIMGKPLNSRKQMNQKLELRLKAAGQIKATVNGQAQTIGIKTKAQVVKNRMGPPLRTAEFDIYFDSGIDDFGGWLQVLKAYKLIKQGGSWYTFTRADGTELKCTSKTWKDKLAENEELRTEVYDLICKTLVMDYKTENLGIDDVEHSDEPVPEG